MADSVATMTASGPIAATAPAASTVFKRPANRPRLFNVNPINRWASPS